MTRLLEYHEIRFHLEHDNERRTGALRIHRTIIYIPGPHLTTGTATNQDTLQELWRIGDLFEWRNVPIEEI